MFMTQVLRSAPAYVKQIVYLFNEIPLSLITSNSFQAAQLKTRIRKKKKADGAAVNP